MILRKYGFDQKGSMLLMTVLLMSGVLVVVLGVADLVTTRIKESKIQQDSLKAFFASEAGAERVLFEMGNLEFPNDGIYATSTLDNGSSYRIDYASSSPIGIFYSRGVAGRSQRVESLIYSLE